jgi:hypothetical protein
MISSALATNLGLSRMSHFTNQNPLSESQPSGSPGHPPCDLFHRRLGGNLWILWKFPLISSMILGMFLFSSPDLSGSACGTFAHDSVWFSVMHKPKRGLTKQTQFSFLAERCPACLGEEIGFWDLLGSFGYVLFLLFLHLWFIHFAKLSSGIFYSCFNLGSHAHTDGHTLAQENMHAGPLQTRMKQQTLEENSQTELYKEYYRIFFHTLKA